MIKDSFLLKLWRVSSIISIIFFLLYLYDIKTMIKVELPQKFIISDISSNLRHTSSIGVYLNNKYYSINVKRKDALVYKVGDSVLLYYNKKHDYFYVPETLTLYFRYIYASVFSFLLTFIPWMKIKKKMDDYNNK